MQCNQRNKPTEKKNELCSYSSEKPNENDMWELTYVRVLDVISSRFAWTCNRRFAVEN